MKKRGHGVDKWNGAGGKLEAGETPLQAAVRETEEEVSVTPLNLELIGEIHFIDLPDVDHYCHIFVTTEWEGEPVETEEMRPQWFTLENIPYDSMWPDDKLWLPILLAGKKFKGDITVDNNVVTKQTIAEVTTL
jgi:mutator protein MutT